MVLTQHHFLYDQQIAVALTRKSRILSDIKRERTDTFLFPYLDKKISQEVRTFLSLLQNQPRKIC